MAFRKPRTPARKLVDIEIKLYEYPLGYLNVLLINTVRRFL